MAAHLQAPGEVGWDRLDLYPTLQGHLSLASLPLQLHCLLPLRSLPGRLTHLDCSASACVQASPSVLP